ncbi:MAG: hypothetical protein HOK06_06190 [Rhodospirillaceae bacterium]|nr:hypothetical protein [Rhodospirillaceae bacterium]MBT4464489.1 hypothetical protein [Rhodospirillaceae bacterium]MBT5014733.1 hypothetical protein [Rhodospirillaceae bacterium]MBT5309437.1 hypothetical protein [Rhodospirillaceae bacterium]MBT6407176.1 hypothetical protein [Rhodospirillaceae bacterium]
MSNLTMTVHEFLAIMGTLDEHMEDSGFKAESAIYDAWYQQWRDLEAKVEKLSMMDRADMLFDGKVTINDISDEHLTEAIAAVSEQVNIHQKMIDENDIDADPDDLEIWQNRLETMKTL